jgi:hypothetical protein
MQFNVKISYIKNLVLLTFLRIFKENLIMKERIGKYYY